jgi:hypothetical protein
VVGIVALISALPAKVPNEVVLTHTTLPLPAKAAHPFADVASSRPLSLSVPALGIKIGVDRLGLQPDHQVMVPVNTTIVGWYDLGPTPGQIGSAVILGHVDSYVGPGTFFNLKLLKAGNSIAVTLDDGSVTHFVVTRVVQYSKTTFPDRLVYGSHGTRALNLVTCGGIFDHATGHYESNIVVFSRLVSVTPKRVVRSSV